MRVLVLGGTRFIGPPAVAELVDVGHDVAVYHRGQSHATLPLGVKEYLGDRNDVGRLSAAIREHSAQCILDVCSFEEAHQRNLELACAGLDVKTVLISSCDVYRNFGGLLGLEAGEPDPAPLKEDSPLRTSLYPYKDSPPRPDRDLTKYDKIPIEKRVLSSGGVVARLPMVYGPGDRQHRTYEYVSRMAAGRPHIVLASTMAKWRTCRAHVSNVAHAIRLILEKGSPGRVYNVAEEPVLTELQWVERIAEAMNWKGKIVVVDDAQLPQELRPDSDMRWEICVDTLRLRQEIGYKDVVPLGDAVLETVKWQVRNTPEGAPTPEYAAEDRAAAQGSVMSSD